MDEKPEKPLSPGDRVTVVEGTFERMEGVVISFDEAKRIGADHAPLRPIPGTVWVALAIFDRPTAVNLFAGQLERVPPRRPAMMANVTDHLWTFEELYSRAMG